MLKYIKKHKLGSGELALAWGTIYTPSTDVRESTPFFFKLIFLGWPEPSFFCTDTTGFHETNISFEAGPSLPSNHKYNKVIISLGLGQTRM